MPDVDLVINVFERTFDRVLKPGFVSRIESDNQCVFAQKVVLINNVEDKRKVQNLTQRLVDAGEITAYASVEEHLDDALRSVGLTRRELGRIPHYSDCALVAVHLSGSPWLCYWDAEASLQRPINWIEPAIRMMERDSRILVANPNWWRSGLDEETDEITGSFVLGYGFSDAVFLCRRSDFKCPIYRHWTVASLRYPLAHISPVFEQRVDAYMRVQRKLRATHRSAVYEHPETEGRTYPDVSFIERLRRRRNRTMIGLARKYTLQWHIVDPRLREWGLMSERARVAYGKHLKKEEGL